MSKDSAHMKYALTVAVMSLATIAMAACSDTKLSVNAAAAAPSRVERGKYLVSVIGCNDCHTPLKMGPKGPEPDFDRVLSGHPEQIGRLPAAKAQAPWLWAGAATNTAFAGPWGVSYTANLTPDQNTGLGIWTEEMFIKAIRTGRHMGVSREILPPMPWPAFRNATDEDLKSIYAYLRTLKPVVNHVPDVQPPAAAVDMTEENR
jgi:mono/diheme cytochrome c family protein